MARRKLLYYKEPKIIRCKSGDWYIQYYFRNPINPTKWEPKKERCGINYIKDLEEKEIEAEILRKDVLAWLKEGNTPYDTDPIAEQSIADREADIEAISNTKNIWTIERAIFEYNRHAAAQGHTPATIRTYNRYTSAFSRWLSKNDLLGKKACLFTEMDVQAYLDELYDELGWSGRTFNNYLEFMITFFTKARKLEKRSSKNRALKYEFDPEDLETKITRPQRNKAFTPVVFDKIKKELTDEYSDLRDYLEWITLSAMRPAEIRELKLKDIDHINRQIRIIGKSGDRLIPISDQLLRLIEKRNILSSTLDSYVFGYAGKVDTRRMSVAYFLTQFNEIRDKLKLDKNYGPYSCKPTAVINMIKAGFTDRQIMELTGHRTETAFSAYKRDLVIENSNAMKGSTIEF